MVIEYANTIKSPILFPRELTVSAIFLPDLRIIINFVKRAIYPKSSSRGIEIVTSPNKWISRLVGS